MTSFLRDLTAASEALGNDKIGLIFGVAMADWTDETERDNFLLRVTSEQS